MNGGFLNIPILAFYLNQDSGRQFILVCGYIDAAVAACDLFYALMALPTMIAVLLLSGKVRKATSEYFNKKQSDK